MIELEQNVEEITRIAVVGVGGAGCNAVRNILGFGIEGAELIAINTDLKQLRNIPVPNVLAIGKKITNGQGAGANPEIGRKAAEEDYEEILRLIENKHLVIITAGMGGGTGTGAAPVVARAAREIDALVIAVVLTPSAEEGPRKMKYAIEGLRNLREYVDGLIVVSNDKLFEYAKEKQLPFFTAFKEADKIVYDAAKGIVDLVHSEGVINVDFADLRTVIKDKGDALIGKGFGEGEGRAIQAVENALNSPLLEGIDLRDAKSALINIISGDDFFLDEIRTVLEKVRQATNKDLDIIYGLVHDPNLAGKVSVTIIITGFTNSFIENADKDLIEEVMPIGDIFESVESDVYSVGNIRMGEERSKNGNRQHSGPVIQNQPTNFTRRNYPPTTPMRSEGESVRQPYVIRSTSEIKDLDDIGAGFAEDFFENTFIRKVDD